MKPVKIPSFMSIGTTGIELRELKGKKKNNMDKKEISSNMRRKWYFSEIFYTQFYFDMFYTV